MNTLDLVTIFHHCKVFKIQFNLVMSDKLPRVKFPWKHNLRTRSKIAQHSDQKNTKGESKSAKIVQKWNKNDPTKFQEHLKSDACRINLLQPEVPVYAKVAQNLVENNLVPSYTTKSQSNE